MDDDEGVTTVNGKEGIAGSEAMVDAGGTMTFDGIEGIDDGESMLDNESTLGRSTRCKKKSLTLSTPYTVVHVRTKIKNKDNLENSSGDI